MNVREEEEEEEEDLFIFHDTIEGARAGRLRLSQGASPQPAVARTQPAIKHTRRDSRR
jgi:hypothetical protein